MKAILIIFMFCSMLIGYQKGDIVDASIIQKLHLQTDKVYIIDFFASWCDSCKKEIPLLSKFHTQSDPAKVELIGICVDQNEEMGMRFQEKLKARGTLNFRVINDPKNELIKAFNPIGMPALYYIKAGKVVGNIMGAVADIDTVISNDLKNLH